SLLSVVTVVGIFLVVPILLWGFLRMQLNVLDGKPDLKDLFSGFSDYVGVLVPMLVLFAAFFVLGLIGGGTRIFGETLGGLLNVVFALAVTARFSFALYYVVDQGLAPSEALMTSWQVTSPQKLSIAALTVVTWVLLVVGFFMLIVGIIPASMI